MKREINYVRISVTDKCNLRCNYCMPKNGMKFYPNDEILNAKEIIRLVNIFASLGVEKIRFTGGEPLLRKELIDIISETSKIKGINEVCLTTNGILLQDYVRDLHNAGLDRINISLDSLKKDMFQDITGFDNLSDVLLGIKAAAEGGFALIKVNTVIMKGVNDDEIYDFINFALKNNIILRFIEFMKVTPLWREENYMAVRDIIEVCKKKYMLERLDEYNTGPAQYCKIFDKKIGFIRTHSENCSKCDRVRITPVGRLKVCLYETEGLDIKRLLRAGYDDKYIADIMASRMGVKNNVSYNNWEERKIYMSSVGG